MNVKAACGRLFALADKKSMRFAKMLAMSVQMWYTENEVGENIREARARKVKNDCSRKIY